MTAVDYQALTESSAFLDLSARGRFCVMGADRAAFLHGQVTNQVKNLQPGQGCYAALANNKGKMTGDLNIFVLADEILLDFEPGLAPKVRERLEKFIIADDVEIADASAFKLISVLGPQAASVCGRLGIPVPEAPFETVEHQGCYVALTPRFGIQAVDIFAPEISRAQLRADMEREGVREVEFAACEVVRIENGVPRFGADMDENTLVPEAIEHAISYNKGCYIGQEVIARIRTYGQVAKALRGLRFAENAAVSKPGDKIIGGEKEVGWITSSAFSPRLKCPVALGYVRRECNQLGARLSVNGAAAEIVPLPFRP